MMTRNEAIEELAEARIKVLTDMSALEETITETTGATSKAALYELLKLDVKYNHLSKELDKVFATTEMSTKKRSIVRRIFKK